jgi:hypothetical protein
MSPNDIGHLRSSSPVSLGFDNDAGTFFVRDRHITFGSPSAHAFEITLDVVSTGKDFGNNFPHFVLKLLAALLPDDRAATSAAESLYQDITPPWLPIHGFGHIVKNAETYQDIDVFFRVAPIAFGSRPSRSESLLQSTFEGVIGQPKE